MSKFIMNEKTLKKSIKTLSKIISFYEKHPCVLDMGTYKKCALGKWCSKKVIDLSSANSHQILKKYFKIKYFDSLCHHDLKLATNISNDEKNVLELFCSDGCYPDNVIKSKDWVKEAKKVLNYLKSKVK